MIKVVQQDNKVYLILDKLCEDVINSMKGFNKAGVDILTMYDSETKVYRINDSEDLARISITEKIVPCGTVFQYEKRKKEFPDQMLSYFAN